MDAMFLGEEFWWLKRLELPLEGTVGVALSRWSDPRYYDSDFEPKADRVSIDDLNDWAVQQRWENVHRTLTVEDVAGGLAVGPMVVDIETEELDFDGAANSTDAQLEGAKTDALRVVEYFHHKGSQENDRSSGPHHQDSGEAKIRESTAGVSRKPSSDCKACGCSSRHLCGLTAWNT